MEFQSNARKEYSEKHLLHLKDSVVGRPNTSNLHLLHKSQSLPAIHLQFATPYLLT